MFFLGTFPFLFGSYNKVKMYFKNTHKILEEKYFRCYTSFTSKSRTDYFLKFQMSGCGTPVFRMQISFFMAVSPEIPVFDE